MTRRPEDMTFSRLTLVNFLTAFTSTVVFKLALFTYSASGAEGVTSRLLLWPRLALCLGWDVLSAWLVAAVGALLAYGVASRFPRAAFGCASTVQALYAVFLVVSFHIALIVGAPLDKAAIDLLLYNATPGRTGNLLSSSIGPYLTRTVDAEFVVALALSLVAFRLWQRRVAVASVLTRRRVATLGVLVFLTLVAVPGLANGLLAVHTFGLERSPLTMLVGSYARGPWRALGGHDVPDGDPFCLDQRSPVPVDGDNPLTQATPARTNVVLILLESVSTRSLLPPPTPMPFLDEMARAAGSVRFDTHYAHWAQTMNAAFNIWCSELPHPDYPPITYVNPAIPCVSLTEALKSAGYDTAVLTSADFAFDRQIRFLKHRQIDFMADRNDLPGHEGAWESAWGIDERVTTRAVLGWIERQRAAHPERPFFAAYNMAAGHHPYEFPGSPSGLWLDSDRESAAQRATLRFIDDRIRDIVDGLARLHLRESTLVVVVSDHGPGSGRAGMGRIRDASIYEGSVHVPLVFMGPQLAGVHGPVTLPTGHIDVAPTVLGLLGLEPPATMKGRDLTRDSEGRVVILATRPPLSQVGVRAGPWKLVHWDETGVNELFDVARDPDERDDVAKAHPDLTATLAAIGRRWQVHSRNLIENYAAIKEISGRRCSALPVESRSTRDRVR